MTSPADIRSVATMREAKEIKVRVETGSVLKLQQRKILTGRPISVMVQEALDLYFARS